MKTQIQAYSSLCRCTGATDVPTYFIKTKQMSTVHYTIILYLVIGILLLYIVLPIAKKMVLNNRRKRYTTRKQNGPFAVTIARRILIVPKISLLLNIHLQIPQSCRVYI